MNSPLSQLENEPRIINKTGAESITGGRQIQGLYLADPEHVPAISPAIGMLESAVALKKH
jgi:hypothetical protein